MKQSTLDRLVANTKVWQNYILTKEVRNNILNSGPFNLDGVEEVRLPITLRSGKKTNHHFLGFNHDTWMGVCNSVKAVIGRDEVECKPHPRTDEYGRPY